MSKYSSLKEIKQDIKRVRLEKNIIKEKMRLHVNNVEHTFTKEVQVISFSYVAARVVKQLFRLTKR
jgi:hypothetical protein